MKTRSAYWSRIYRTVLLLGSVWLVTACEEVIESPFEIVEPKLVISSTFTPYQAVSVQLSATQPSVGELQDMIIDRATVMLFEGTEPVEELIYQPGDPGKKGVYVTQRYLPSPGKQYVLHVAADGFTPVSATSEIPESIAITSIDVHLIGEREVGTQKLYDYELIIDYADPVDEDNFYDIRLSQQVIPFSVDAAGDTVRYDAISKAVSSPGESPLRFAPGTQSSILLRDKPHSDGLSIRLQSEITPDEELLGFITAELRTVSREYYLFQRNVQGEGAVFTGIVEPRVNSYTNVTSGFGFFAGYNTDTRVHDLNSANR